MKGEKKVYVIFSVILLVVSLLEKNYKFFGADYLVYILFLASVFLYRPFRKIKWPAHYAWFLLAFLGVAFVNAFVSPYVPSPVFIALGTAFTILPFVHFLFSYNITPFSEKQIDSFIKVLIKTITVIAACFYVETILFDTNFKYSGSLLGSSLLATGFFASLLNQGIILSLCLWYKRREQKLLWYIGFFALSVLLTVQFKAIIGTFFILTMFFLLIGRGRVQYVFSGVLILLVLAIALVNVPAFQSKFMKYADIYNVKENTQGVARVELYRTAFKISGDYFPLGTGQGTYGSIVENLKPSKVYAHYGISHVYGLDERDSVSFKFDTHWSNVIGENGVLGLLLYMLLFLYPLRHYRRRKGSRENRAYWFIILTSPLCVVIESITLAIPSKFAFIIIYSGLCGIILRYNHFQESRL